MNWIVSVKIYGHGASTYVKIAGASKQEIDIALKAETALEEAEDYDKTIEAKNFETQIYKKLRYYINLSRWKSLLEANFWVEKNNIIFDTGY